MRTLLLTYLFSELKWLFSSCDVRTLIIIFTRLSLSLSLLMSVHSSAMDASSTAGSLMKPAAVGESEASVEGHVTPRRRGSVSMNHTASRTTTASVISRSTPTDRKSLVNETPIKHKVISVYWSVCLSASCSSYQWRFYTVRQKNCTV